MYILGIESSCDDTSVALLNSSSDGHVIISEKTASQIDIHKKYGGVVPEIAGRLHAEKIVPLIEAVLENQPKPDAIAVTAGPGLVTGLLVGVTAAQTLSYATGIPLVSVNHLDGHIHSVELAIQGTSGSPITQFPALCLVVSGGHTELVLMEDHGEYQIIGATKDDAAGECFDKIAKLLDLPYPGGPQISKLGTTGNPNAIEFPRPMINEKMNFSAKGGPAFGWSFAGLKTAALYWRRDHEFGTIAIQDFAASIEQAIVDVLVAKTLRAAENFQPKTVILAGGVAGNKKLRAALETALSRISVQLRTPLPQYCMDNGAMIAAAGYWQAARENFTDWNNVEVDPNWKIDQEKTNHIRKLVPR